MINRYTSSKMKKIWSDQYKFDLWLKVEKSLIMALRTEGIVPKNDANKILLLKKINKKNIYEFEKQSQHEITAFLYACGDLLTSEKKWLNYGITSSDIIDTAEALRLKKVNSIIKKKLSTLKNKLKELAINNKKTLIIGRTHGIHAELTSFGHVLVCYYEQLNRCINKFNKAANEIKILMMSGSVGNFAHIGLNVEKNMANYLKLKPLVISNQAMPRDLFANYIFSISLLASWFDNFSTEIRNLQRTEISEVCEKFDVKKQYGSSSMPQKKNPILSENISGLTRILKSYISVSLNNITLWNERDMTHSSNERIIFSDSTTLLEFITVRMQKILNNLCINKQQMLINIKKTNGTIFSQKLALLLIKKYNFDRIEAFKKIKKIINETDFIKTNFKNAIKKSDLPLNNNDIEQCFNSESYLQNIDNIFKKISN